MADMKAAAKAVMLRYLPANVHVGTLQFDRIVDDVAEIIAKHAPDRYAAWKEAIVEACVVNHLGWDENDPVKSLANLIQWEVTIALDPKVSEQAADLVSQAHASDYAEGLEQAVSKARAEGMEEACKILCKECGEEGLLVMFGKSGGVWHSRFIGDEMQIPCSAASIRRRMEGK